MNQPLKIMEKLIARQADKVMTKEHDIQHGLRKNKVQNLQYQRQ